MRTCATWAITRCYRPDDVQPRLKEALASNDKRMVDGVLFAIQIGRYSGLREEVRHIAWSADDLVLQISAILALDSIGDRDGIQKIAATHPNKRLREIAAKLNRP